LKKYELILFDLDGTLTDSAEGIVNSVQYALRRIGIIEEDRYKLNAFIGPPLVESFQKFYNFNTDLAWEAVQYYREYFSEKGMYENRVYPGVPLLLQKLQDESKYLAVATSKPGVYSEEILEHFDLRKYFNLVTGSNLDGSRINKADIISFVMGHFQQIPVDKVIMVGDRKHDVEGARVKGIDAAAVTYGYGSREELIKANPVYLIDTIDELETLLCQTIY